MQKVKIKVSTKLDRSRIEASFESDIVTALKPATPTETLIEAARHLAHLAEAYAGEGSALIDAVTAEVQLTRSAKIKRSVI